jgi:hypothetical protein
MMDRLLYRRQFLLARNVIKQLDGWNIHPLGPYFLHSHPDLEITFATGKSRSVVMAGYIFDPFNVRSTNQDILIRILDDSLDLGSFLIALKPYAGRYAIFYRSRDDVYVVQDALALREVFFCQRDNAVICGSQPNLLAHFSRPKLDIDQDPDLQRFLKNDFPLVRDGRLWVGDGSPYRGVKHVLPNHCLDINNLQTIRYWPNNPIGSNELNKAVDRSSQYLSGVIKAASYRHPLMMAVTAGEDSRGLLAASKDIAGSIYFFINQHDRLREDSPDIRIPRELFKIIGFPFHVHRYPENVPDDFKEIFFQNAAYARKHLLPVIYNIYYREHSDKLNILGVGEVGRTKFYDEPRILTPYYLAYMLRYRRSPFAVKECKRWLDAARPIAAQHGLNIMTMFWWEMLIGNWGAVGNTESDIAIEEFDPYDSHYLYELFLSVDAKYRTLKNNILFKELIRFMWPQLLELPVNPPDSKKARLYAQLNRLGIEQVLRRSKARLNEFAFHLYWKHRKSQHGT